MTIDEITRLVDAVTDADRSATIHGGTDRARRASDARSALLRAVEGVVGRLETETKERERCRYGWKRCAADLASETARANRAEERAEAAIAERDEAMKRASVAKGASEYEARRAESAEAALAEMREALDGFCIPVLLQADRTITACVREQGYVVGVGTTRTNIVNAVALARHVLASPPPAAPPKAPASETPEPVRRVAVEVTRRTDDAETLSFDAPGFHTVRPCVDCGVLMRGGPTRCLPCAAKMPAPTPGTPRTT